MYYKRPTKGVFSGQIVAGSGHSFRSFIRVFIRVFRVIRGQVIFAFGSMRAGCPRSDGIRVIRVIRVIRGKKTYPRKTRNSRNKRTTTNDEQSNEPIQFSKTSYDLANPGHRPLITGRPRV